MTRSPARTLRSSLAAGGALVLLTGLAACGSNDTAGPTAAAPTTSSPAASAPAAAPKTTASGTLTAADQNGDGTSLSVASVDLTGAAGGWVAVHADLDGKPGPVVGVAQIKEGSNTDVKVTLDKTATTGAFWPMLHVDDSTLGTYEFPKTAGADLPVTSGAGIVMQKITLTVG